MYLLSSNHLSPQEEHHLRNGRKPPLHGLKITAKLQHLLQQLRPLLPPLSKHRHPTIRVPRDPDVQVGKESRKGTA